MDFGYSTYSLSTSNIFASHQSRLIKNMIASDFLIRTLLLWCKKTRVFYL